MSNTLQDLLEANSGVYLSGVVSGSTWANELDGAFGTFALTDVAAIDGVDGITGGNGLSFSGSTTTIATSARTIAANDVFTMSFWLYMDSLANMYVATSGPTLGWNVFVTSLGALRVRSETTNLVNTGNAIISPQTWHRVTIAQNGASDHVAIVDNVRYTGSLTATYTSGVLSLGALSSLTSNRLSGDIAYFSMCDEVLTTTETQAVHERALWQPTDVYILWGQSNMVGLDTGTAPASSPDVWEYEQTGILDVAIEPMRHQTVTAGGVGPGLTFGKSVHAATGRRILLVPTAKGGTKLATGGEWASGGASRTLMYANGDAALSLSPDTHTLRGIVGHQGESDTPLAADANAYAANIDSFIADARSHFGQPNLPWVQGQLGDFYGVGVDNVNTVKAAIAGLTSRNSRTAVASASGLTDLGDAVHFDVASAIIMGERLGAAYLTAAIGGRATPYIMHHIRNRM